jgi:hypothetical protein
VSRIVEAAVLQLVADPGDRDANLDRLAGGVRGCAGADLIVAGELVNCGYDLDLIAQEGAEWAERLDGPTVTLTRELAAETGATIVVGLLEHDGDRLYDSAVVVAPAGTVVPYRKSHLYPPERNPEAASGSNGRRIRVRPPAASSTVAVNRSGVATTTDPTAVSPIPLSALSIDAVHAVRVDLDDRSDQLHRIARCRSRSRTSRRTWRTSARNSTARRIWSSARRPRRLHSSIAL